jgi:hypothetical protein
MISNAHINRRTFLAIAAGLATATATLGLAIALPAKADPIYAAIACHQAAARAWDAAYASWPAPYPKALGDAGDVEIAAIDRVIYTAPTTREGLKTLTDYLAELRSGCIAAEISYRLEMEGYTFDLKPPGWFDGAVAFFIARRASEIA